ncbi:MAG TPA: hydroxymethylglutaryl-CoA synthase family protein [Labilithrix sp.]|nr:hydroxymethylglutaryl-CoA synthase family protein [Labilithrix sp.]
MPIGLEAIGLYVPKHYIELDDLAKARGVDPAKYRNGLGQRRMAVATPCEDTVTLAVGAARSAIARYGIDPESIGQVVVGTETGIDHSKPVSVYVSEFLGLPTRSRSFEIKHACFGAMAGLAASIDWIRSGRARGRKALVVASDIARYEMKGAGEPTGGAGAVAMVVSDSPTLVDIDAEADGCYSRQVMDFWRPLYRKEPVVDGHYSIGCYLDALSGAYAAYRESTTIATPNFASSLVATLFHAPFAKMVKKAHQRLLEDDAQRRFENDAAELERVQEDFQRRVLPYLEANANIGNLYTGSLFVSLLNFIERAGSRHVGERISLFGYGSGCAAEFTTARVLDGCKAIPSPTYEAVLAERWRIDIPQYEAMTTAAASMDADGATVCDPARWGVHGDALYLGTKNHVRQYATVRASS